MNSPHSPRLSYLALGDSYTIGEGVSPNARWPVQLANRLCTAGYPLDNPKIIAQTGWTTGELLQALEFAELQPSYDLVSLLIGVNNQYRGQALNTYRVEFRRLLERAMALSGGQPARMLVLSIPDWGVTPFAQGRDRETIAREIEAFNAANREIAGEYEVEYIDVTHSTRKFGSVHEYLADDGLHPSGMMYALWTEQVLPAARRALDEQVTAL